MNQQSLELHPLNAAALDTLPDPVAVPGYDRSKVRAGIAHIGVGNFHRSHEALYVDRCLHLPDHESWGICGIGLGAGAEARSKADALRKQDGLYTLTEYAPDGDARCRVIGSIVEYMFASDDPEAVLVKLADPAIRIVSLTITEGGYNFDASTGEFLLSAPDVAHDLTASMPRTVFGYIVTALKRRRDAGVKAFTVVSCDNLRQNGNTTKRAILSFAAAIDKDLAAWIEANAAFPNSMVDRIAPQVSEAVKTRANTGSGIEDVSPVVAETFTQWVIEDRFADGRPDLSSVGVDMRDDVEAYEGVKGRMLNASHMLLSYPAVLLGYRLVHEAMADTDIVALLSTFMEKDAIPVIDGPSGLSLSAYKDLTIERFRNPAVADQLLRVARNGAAKIPVFHTKTTKALLDSRSDIRREALLLAGFRRYLRGVDARGVKFDVDEPRLTPKDWQIIREDERVGVLHISPFSSLRLYENSRFVEAFLELSSLFDAGQARRAIQKVI